jgi:hypothetical protein
MTEKESPSSTATVDRLDGHEFEDLIENLLKKMGFVIGERKLSADGGIDLLAESYEPMLEGKYIIQCKRQSKKVEQHVIRDLYGVVHSSNANKGILITNSVFTEASLKFAQNKQLELIDGEKLQRLLVKYNLQTDKNREPLPNSARFLLNNLVPALRKIQKEVDDSKNGLVYLERNSYPLKKYLALIEVKLKRQQAYCEFVTKTLNQCLGHISMEADDVQQTRDASFRIVDATKKLVLDYQEVLGIVSPNGFEQAHAAFIAYYPHILGTLWKLSDDIENATLNPESRTYQISFVFDLGEEGRRFNEELAKLAKR